MDEDMRYQLFGQVCADDCASWECQYLDVTSDPHMTGDNDHEHYECTGSSAVCPVVDDMVDSMRDYPQIGEV